MDEKRFTLPVGDDEHLSCILTEAYSHRAVIMAPGFTDDKHVHGVFDTAAEQLAADNYTVIRFDYRGWGESTGSPPQFTLTSAAADMETVYSYAVDMFEQVACIGFSLGAAITAKAQLDSCADAFWSPAIYYTERMAEHLREQGLNWEDVLTREKTAIALWGEEYTFSHEFFEELYTMDVADTLKKRETPTLLVHGTEDSSIPSQDAVKLMESMQCRRELVMLHGDHHLRPSLGRALQETVKWFDEYCGEDS